MFKVSVEDILKDMNKILDNFGKYTLNQIAIAVKQVSVATYNYGLTIAQGRLHTTLSDFRANYKMKSLGKTLYMVYIEDESRAYHLEEGWGSFNMKPGFLKSSKAKTSKDGKRYFDVPFEINTSKKTGASKSVTSMRQAVANAMRDKTKTVSSSKYDPNSKGLNRFGDVSVYNFNDSKSYYKDDEINIRGQHLSGLTRIKDPNKKSGGRFFLFRRVSEKGMDTNPRKRIFGKKKRHWMHPGFDGLKMFDSELIIFAQGQLQEAIRKIIG